VLDEAYAQSFIRRFSGRPDWNRPELWPIIHDPVRAKQRQWLSETISRLRPDQQTKALARLEGDAQQFLATYHELAVCALLRDSTLTVDFEPELPWKEKVLTPDIGLRGPGGTLGVLVEVSTKFRTAAQRDAELHWKELRGRVNRILRPLGLTVRDLTHNPGQPPDGRLSRRIEASLRRWLLSTRTTLGSTCVVEGYAFQVVVLLPGLRADIATPTGTDWYNTDMVRKAINVKVSRYAELASSLGVLLVVVLAAEPAMPLSVEMVRSALEGVQGVAIGLDPFGFGPISTGPVHLNERNVPAKFHSALSMVGWLQPGIDVPGSLTFLDVPGAARRPGDSFVQSLSLE